MQNRNTPTDANGNLFVALRAGFPQDLDALAVETDNGLLYSWRDIERASAMLANLLGSLHLPPGARIAVQVEKSVESMLLYLATLATMVALTMAASAWVARRTVHLPVVDALAHT